MLIHNDLSYINQDLIQRGLMTKVPHSIRLDSFCSDKQKLENTEFIRTHTKEECQEMFKNRRLQVASEIYQIVKMLSKHYDIGQFEDAGKDTENYDLWFWCNDLYFLTNGKESGRDYSYVTLTIWHEDDIENSERIFKEIKTILSDYSSQNVQAYFQYSQIENKENIEAEALRIFSNVQGLFINYGRHIGKIENYNGEYIFKKKYSKKIYYKISPLDICMNVIA